MDKKSIVSLAVGVLVTLGGVFAYGPTEQACKNLLAKPAPVAATEVAGE